MTAGGSDCSSTEVVPEATWQRCYVHFLRNARDHLPRNRFIGHNIAAASTAKTDGWAGYAAVPVESHDPHVIGPMAAHVVLPWIHQLFSNLKGWARGVYHGLRAKHLQSYLDEFVFRFNRRRTRHAAFRFLLAIALRTNRITYNLLVQSKFII